MRLLLALLSTIIWVLPSNADTAEWGSSSYWNGYLVNGSFNALQGTQGSLKCWDAIHFFGPNPSDRRVGKFSQVPLQSGSGCSQDTALKYLNFSIYFPDTQVTILGSLREENTSSLPKCSIMLKVQEQEEQVWNAPSCDNGGTLDFTIYLRGNLNGPIFPSVVWQQLMEKEK